MVFVPWKNPMSTEVKALAFAFTDEFAAILLPVVSVTLVTVTVNVFADNPLTVR